VSWSTPFVWLAVAVLFIAIIAVVAAAGLITVIYLEDRDG
jgi:hypothetical protein